MKRIQVAIAALLLSASFAVAQPPAKAGKRPHFQNKEMAFDQLNLTSDQKVKMKAANDDFKKQIQALNSNENQTVKQQRDARESLMKQHRAQVEGILTADQKAQLQQINKEGKAQRSEVSANHLDKIKKELNLTDQQVSQLKSSQEATNSKMEAIKNNTTLDETAKRQQMQALRQDMKQRMEQLLTPEQKEKWQGMKKDKMHQPHTRRGDYKAPQV